MRRRDVVKLLAGATMVAPLRAAAQSARTYRLAMLTSGPAFPLQNPNVKILLGTLADKGYKLSQNLEFHSYGADAQLPQLPQLVRDIVASKVDAVVVIGWPPANAMKGTGVPTVVAVGAGDPVATGLVASLAHPGGNSPAYRTMRRRSAPNVWSSSSRRCRPFARWRCCGTSKTSA